MVCERVLAARLVDLGPWAVTEDELKAIRANTHACNVSGEDGCLRVLVVRLVAIKCCGLSDLNQVFFNTHMWQIQTVVLTWLNQFIQCGSHHCLHRVNKALLQLLNFVFLIFKVIYLFSQCCLEIRKGVLSYLSVLTHWLQQSLQFGHFTF